MRPLQALAMGLLIVALTASVAGYDLVADPVGWLLVLAGTTRLDVERRRALLLLAGLALLVSAFLWVPAVREPFLETDPSLAWAATLPQLGFCVLLCRGLGDHAKEAGDPGSVAWLRTLAVGFVVLGVLPVLTFGGGLTGLADLTYVLAAVVLLTLVVVLFTRSGRDWAADRSAPTGSTT